MTMNWKSIEQILDEEHVLYALLRVEYRDNSVEYAVGFVADDDVFIGNAIDRECNKLCSLSDIGKNRFINAVYYIDPEEILL